MQHKKTDNSIIDVAIVGGGFSGVCTAYHYLTHEGLKPDFRCAIIEPNERLGAGLAYRTDFPLHLLNVRAKGMSITEADPRSFVDWLAKNAPEFSFDDFAPRGLYRRYIVDCLTDAECRRGPGALILFRDEVVAVELEGEGGSYLLRLKSGNAIHAATVVIAIGNLPCGTPIGKDLLRSPWGNVTAYKELDTLAIVGAGLTAVDVILEAEAAGFTGRYWVISAHGHFPKTHREPHNPVRQELRQWAAEVAARRPRLRQALRIFQQKRKSGVHWEELVDALRRHSPYIWQGFDTIDKRRFLRHLRNLWNIHLHRSSLESMTKIERLMETGRLEHIRGRVMGVEKLSHRGENAVRLVLKSGHTQTLDADMAINGTGLFSNILRTNSLLVARLLEDRMVMPDEFCMGFKVVGNGRLVAANGSTHSGLFTVGTLRRGEELECTAVPEIRRQVKDVVDEIVAIGTSERFDRNHKI